MGHVVSTPILRWLSVGSCFTVSILQFIFHHNTMIIDVAAVHIDLEMSLLSIIMWWLSVTLWQEFFWLSVLIKHYTYVYCHLERKCQTSIISVQHWLSIATLTKHCINRNQPKRLIVKDDYFSRTIRWASTRVQTQDFRLKSRRGHWRQHCGVEKHWRQITLAESLSLKKKHFSMT